MHLSAYGKILLGMLIIAFGITILADFALWKAAIYISAVLVGAMLFL